MMAKRIPRSQPAPRASHTDMPGFIKSQLATLNAKAPKGDQWIHEIKYDGYRIQLNLSEEKVAFTRNGHDWTSRFQTIVDAFKVPKEAIVDGEVAVIVDGRTNFSELHSDIAKKHLVAAKLV
jgi:bifunctional non-homologous end joining protein LigD